MSDKLNDELLKETTYYLEGFQKELIVMLKNDRKLKGRSKTLNSLEIVISASGRYVALMGVDYFYYVVHGRGPGRFPPPYENGEWRMPYPVAYKIAKEGNLSKYKPVADKFDNIYDNVVDKLTKKAGEWAMSYLLKNGTLYAKD